MAEGLIMLALGGLGLFLLIGFFQVLGFWFSKMASAMEIDSQTELKEAEVELMEAEAARKEAENDALRLQMLREKKLGKRQTDDTPNPFRLLDGQDKEAREKWAKERPIPLKPVKEEDVPMGIVSSEQTQQLIDEFDRKQRGKR